MKFILLKKKRKLIMFLCTFFIFAVGLRATNCDSSVYNTTVAATNIESTIGTPALLVDPTLTSTQNTTVGQYEVSVFRFIPEREEKMTRLEHD